MSQTSYQAALPHDESIGLCSHGVIIHLVGYFVKSFFNLSPSSAPSAITVVPIKWLERSMRILAKPPWSSSLVMAFLYLRSREMASRSFKPIVAISG